MEFSRNIFRNYFRLIRLLAWEQLDKSGVMESLLPERATSGELKSLNVQFHHKVI
jgi:hypothetical protein